jgi:hypothetical protein
MMRTSSRPAILYGFLAICICCSQAFAAPPQSSPSNSSVPSAQSGSSQSGSSQPVTSQSGSSGSTPGDSAAKPSTSAPKPSAPQADTPKKGGKDPDDLPQSRLKISVVAADTNKPIGNASVYIRYAEGKTFFTHKDKEAEMNFKTNQDGTVKVPDVPRGKTLIQIVAPGWHTYGKYYDIEKDEEAIQIKLDRPPKWY